jgi:hypothetical protein
MNNAFVTRQAQLLADRINGMAGTDTAKQIETAYRLALARPPTPRELTLARELVEGRSLEDFTNVLLNLSEFLYIE